MIRLDGVRYSVGKFTLDVSLEVRPAEHFVLLGGTGSGKTMMMECICGLRPIEAGSVHVGGQDVTAVEPRGRGVGYMPQDGVLFGHLNVARNIAFAIRARGGSPERRSAEAARLARMLGIRPLLYRHVSGLSGGERQRVALGRALASRPEALLLDEPVSALDEETRDGILTELRRIQRQTGTTTLHVCHNLDEMARVADRVGIIRDGRMIQVGTAEEVRRSPADAGVARLFRLGSVLAGTIRGGQMRFDDFHLPAPPGREGKVEVLIRSDLVRLGDASEAARGLGGKVRSVVWRGLSAAVEVAIGQTVIRAEVPRPAAEELKLAEGKPVAVEIAPEGVCTFGRPG